MPIDFSALLAKSQSPVDYSTRNMVTPENATANLQAKMPQQGKGPDPALIRAIMYGLQLHDSINSAKFFKEQPGNHEMDPIMKPFSHGGAVTMAAGFALQDLIRTALLRASGIPNAPAVGDMAQAFANVDGIQTTNAARRAQQQQQ
jgi:hypothetical protein